MKRLRTFFVLTAILGGVIGHATAQILIPVPEKDTQNWNEVQLTVPLSKTVDFLLGGSVRIGGNLTKPVDGRCGIGFTYKAHKYLSFSQLLFQREAKAPHGRLEHEQRLTLIGTARFPIGKFTLSDRNGFERRWRQPQADSWRYRNRIQLEHPFNVGKKKLTFFISSEPFYDFNVRDWVRHRATIGAGHPFNKHFTGELYYMRQNDGRSRPGDLHVIGTAMRFRM